MRSRFILWQVYHPLQAEGGAQVTDKAHILYGQEQGYHIEVVTPDRVNSFLMLEDDVVIASNITADTFPPPLFQNLISRGIKYVFFPHDYAPICKHRLFFPMRPECHSCAQREAWLPILLHSALIIWLSPLHRQGWLFLCPEIRQHPYALIPSPIDPEKFYDMGRPRKDIISAAGLWPFKGRGNLIAWAKEHPEEQVDVCGGIQEDILLPSNVKYIGDFPHAQMNEIFNNYERSLFLPNTPQPFNRFVAESYLSGCKLMGNRLIGCLSYPWFKSREEVARYCSQSPVMFWRAVAPLARV